MDATILTSGGIPHARPRFAPGWLPTIVMLVVVALTLSLGRWQLARGQHKVALQSALDAAQAMPPIVLGADPVAREQVEHRRVVAVGEFVAGSTIFLDNRTRAGRPGFEVVTALRLTSTSAVPVVRGWVAADPAHLRVAPAVTTPAGPVRIEGVAWAQPGQFMSLSGAGVPTLGGLWQNFDADAYMRETGLRQQPFVVRQTSALDDGLVRDWPRADSGAAKHWSYAAQWFAMAIAAVAWWIVFGLKRARRARTLA